MKSRYIGLFATVLLIAGFCGVSAYGEEDNDMSEIRLYIPFDNSLKAYTPEREIEPQAGIVMVEDYSQNVTVEQVSKGGKQMVAEGGQELDTEDPRFAYTQGLVGNAVDLKESITYKVPWMKDMDQGTIAVWYRNPVWALRTWRVPAMITPAQNGRAKPAAFQNPLSWWIFDRMTSPPEQGQSKWIQWDIVNNEHPRNMVPRAEDDDTWHSWVLRWDKNKGLLEVLDDGVKRDIAKYDSLIPEGKDHWVDYYLGKESVVYEDPGHVKFDEILLGELHLSRFIEVEIDEVYVLNHAVPDSAIESAMSRVKKGEPAWPKEQHPKPRMKLGEGLDLAAEDQSRPALPEEVQWGEDGAYVVTTPTRKMSCLNGYWRFQPADTRFALPDPENWGFVRLPGQFEPGVRNANRIYDSDFKILKDYQWQGRKIDEYEAVWFERDVDVPADQKGWRFFLRFDRVDRHLPFLDLYVNGKYVMRLKSFGPGHVDVTDFVEPGKSNRIDLTLEGNKHLFFDWYLDARRIDKVSTHDIYVIPEWRRKSVRLRFLLENHTGEPQTYVYGADFFEYDTDNKVHSIKGREITIPPKTRREVEIDGEWRDPHCWSVNDPFLHTVQLTVADRSGKELDRSEKVRFGYREIWVEKGWIYMNGARIHNRGIGQGCGDIGYHKAVTYADLFNHSCSFFALHRKVGTIVKRGLNKYSTAAILDAADEIGFLTTLRAPGTGFKPEIIWHGNKMGQEQAIAFIRWLRNHPSLFAHIVRQSGNHEQTEGAVSAPFRKDASWIPYHEAWNSFVAPLQKAHPTAFFTGMWLPYGNAIGPQGGKHGYGFPLQSREEQPRHYANKDMAYYNAEMGWPQITRNIFDVSTVDDLLIHSKHYWPRRTQINEPLAAAYFGDRAYDPAIVMDSGLDPDVYKHAADGKIRFDWDYVRNVETIGMPFSRVIKYSFCSPALVMLRELFTERMIKAWRWYGYGYWEHTETMNYFEEGIPSPTRMKKEDSDALMSRLKCRDRIALRGPGFYIESGRNKPVEKVLTDPAQLMEFGKLSTIGKIVKKEQRPLAAWIFGSPDFVQKDHAYFEGETINKQIGVISEYNRPVEGLIHWRVTDVDKNREIAAAEYPFRFENGGQQLLPVRLKAPQVDEKSSYRMEIETEVNGEIVHSDTFDFQVFPEHRKKYLKGRIALLDSGATGLMLRIAGVSFTPVDEKTDLGEFDLLIIGRKVEHDKARALLKRLNLQKHLEKGLNLLVMEQVGEVLERPEPDPWPMMTNKIRGDRPELVSFGLKIDMTGNRYSFIRDSAHPVLDGLSNEDLANWRGAANLIRAWSRPKFVGPTPVRDRSWREEKASNFGDVATYVYEKPQMGNFSSLVDASFGLLYSALLEEVRPNGRTMYCQLNVGNRYGVDPAATKLLDNLLAYMLEKHEGPAGKAAFVGNDEWRKALEHLPYDWLKPDRFRDAKVVMVGMGTPRLDNYDSENKFNGVEAVPADKADTASQWLKSNADSLKAYVKEGGCVMLLPTASGEDLGWLPFSCELKTEKVFVVQPNGLFSRYSELSPADLFWLRAIELPIYKNLPEGSRTSTPAVMARVPYGKGEFILCQLQPRMLYGNWRETKICRVLSQILMEKGVEDAHNLDQLAYGYQEDGYPYMGPALYFDPLLSTSW